MAWRWVAAAAALAALPAVLGAGHDNDVEWNGLSHSYLADRTPLCPINGEAFVVRLQAYDFDLTSVRVYVNAGSPTWVEAAWTQDRGGYDVWSAVIPASAPTGTLEYYFEVTDGTDTDYLGPAGPSDAPPASGWTLNFATLAHAPLGCTRTSDGGAVFKVWAGTASSAYVAGQFNGWNPTSLPMVKSGAYFTRKVAPPVNVNQQYKFVFQPGTVWKPDARGRAQNPSDNNNSYVIDPTAYAWGDAAWQTPDFEGMILYELHVGTFSGLNDGLNRSGRFRDIVDRHLDHLVYLGVNAVELMPVTEFDYHESWGYNPVNQWAPENAYGSPDDFRYTVDRLHQAGIAVILDVVYNHFSGSGNFLWYYDGGQIYFDNPAVQTPWGSQAAFWKSEVRDYFRENILHWLDEYHVDGFRMDATRYMRDNWMFPDGYPEGWSLMQEINDLIDRRKADALSIAEELPNDSAITQPTVAGGAGFDGQWHDQFGDDVRQEFFDAAFGDPEMWRIASAINAPEYPDKTKLVRYVESHDEADDARLALLFDSSNPYSVWARGRSKLIQGLTVLVPGIPMFLQGGEWMETIPFGSGYGNRIDWSKSVSRQPITLFFHHLLRVRRENCGFRSNAGCQIHHVDDYNNVIAFHRWCTDGNDLIVVASLNNADLYNYQVGFPQPGVWYELLNSQSVRYLGNNVGNGGQVSTVAAPYDGMPHSALLTIPQMGLLVFRYNDPPNAPLRGDANCDGVLSFADINPFVGIMTGQAPCSFDNADVNGDWAVDFGDINAFVAALSDTN